MLEPINPFNDQAVTGSIINRITDREKWGISPTALAVELPTYDYKGSLVFFIEHEFLYGNAQSEDYQRIKDFVQGAWLNNHIRIEGNEVISLPLLQQKLAAVSLPHTPKEKLDNLLLYIAKRQPEDSAGVEIHMPIAYKRMYFRSIGEASFYLNALQDDGLIVSNSGMAGITYARLTYKGLSYAASLEQQQAKSSLCFIAMSFDDSVKHLYTDAIRPACEATGFEPFRVDEYHPDAEQTINDAIIAGIKRSRFCIADFTQHKKGVYFEAGYALGRGLKVIYTCRGDEFKDSHFDTNHYPHIIYDTPEQLRAGLIAKIEAWIKD
ncbi:hypothetical protein GCM10027422_47360 [Hymenobacter arcticus]